jgi:penicillin-binding protein 1C
MDMFAMDVLWQPGKYRRWRITAIVGLLLVLVLSVLDRRYPLPLPHDNQPSVIVIARDGTPLRAFASDNGVWRYPVTPEQVSPLYLQALIGYEDRYFWRHPGVNPVALLRAAGQWLRHGHIVSGGSTLSMQVARILEPQPRTAFGKFKQVLRALQLEWHLSKRDILILYLNHAPFGGTVEGVEAASWAYLGKPSSQLSHAEAALLAVLPQSPSRLRPDRQADAARRARDKVLARLATQRIWSEKEVRDALIEPVVSRRLHTPMLSPLLAERLRQANPGRTQIRSTIDADLQQLLEERVAAYFNHLPPRSSAAVLVVDNRTLEARAYIGSLQFADQNSLGHVDMVRATRSPGSTLKPFLYGLAMDDGLIHSESLLVDAPQSFGDYRPANFEPTFNGPVSAADALRLSLNVPAVDLLDRLGPERFAARLAHAGVALKFPVGGKPNLALILGGTGVSLEQLVGAYVALNRDGLAGSVKYTPGHVASERRLLSPGAAWIIRDILEHHAQDGLREDTFDTGNRSRIAWKTGTSYGFRDAWALGSTAQYTVGVWIGRPDGTPMPGQYGAITALPLMFEVVNSLPRNASVTADRVPADVRAVKICWPLGLPEDPAHPELCRQQHDAWTLNDNLPPTFPERDAQVWSAGQLDIQVDKASGERLSENCRHTHVRRDVAIARWPSLAYPWLSLAERRAASIPALAPDCAADALAAVETLRIDGPAEGSAIARVPNSLLPPQIRLRALGTNERVRWLVNGELVGESVGSQGFVHAFATAGDQRITALADTGAWAELHLRVLN